MSQAITNKILQAFEEAQKKKNIQQLTKQSLDWFSNHVQRVAKLGRSRIGLSTVKDVSVASGRVMPGNIYLYVYDPKLKETLPFYDTLPLVLVTSVTKTGWYGINFHYMPPAVRKAIMAALYANLTSTKAGNVKLKMSWAIAKQAATAASKSKYLNHSIKQYLRGHVRSEIMKIEPEAWDMVLFLPLQRFQKAKTKKVWGSV